MFEPPPEFDDYVIVRPLGQGAMGQVYLAEDAVLARQIAIKFVSGDAAPDVRQRFLMEARAAARIQHPNVVSIYRVGELGDRPYIVSELVRGRPLSELERPMEWTAALALGIDLARGLAAAHRRGVVHCDVKPSNVIVTDEGSAKLLDFGLALVVREGSDDTSTMLVGTPDYMAPEVWTSAATRRSDVYSLGAVLYELVSGKPPFAHVAPGDLRRVTAETDAPTVDTDPRFAAIVSRCLSRDPSRRFATGDELREALERVEATRSAVAHLDENPYRGLRPFESSHRGVFFGRGPEVGTIVERLRTEAVVVVVGDSGVGKSSLCRAGVIPAIVDGALEDQRAWRSLTIVPGRHPLAAIGAALGDPELAAQLRDDPGLLARTLHHRAGAGGLILFVDQMEELVTVGDPDEVAVFDAALARLSEGVTAVRLITTVRSDFLSRFVALPRFGQELARVLQFVRALPPERIRDVITGPATATGVRFESEEMIDALVAATAEAGSGGLPLLSFALAELWETHDRDRKLITQATLDAMGGVSGALARHADTVISGMTKVERADARRVLLRLVTSDGTRVRRSESELAIGEPRALGALVKGRLVAVHDGEAGSVYELAHEVLVRGWGTLREWLDADVEQRARRERLAEACAEWERLGRRGDATWRGKQLAEAQGLDAENLTAIEREFVAASTRGQWRRKWLRRVLAIGVAVMLIAGYAIQRFVTARRLATDIDEAVRSARAELETARSLDREQRTLAARAFASFDAGSPDAEASWIEVLARRTAAVRAYRGADRTVEAALAKDPTRADVRALLGDVLVERALLADNLGDAEIRDELSGRIGSYDDDGSRRARLVEPGHLTIDAMGVAITIDGKSASTTSDVEVGVHVVEAGPVRLVVRVERGATVAVTLRPPARSVPAGYIYIPAGAFLYGSAADEDTRRSFLSTVPIHTRTTPAFLIARDEVTFAEWLAFVDAQPKLQRGNLLPHLPIGPGVSGVVVERVADRWQLTLQPVSRRYQAGWSEPIHYEGRDRRSSEDWRKFPVLGISADDAEAYVAWLDRSGQVPGARLCTELEWERAARGADERETPTGKPLGLDDANLDTTYGRELIGPDEVGVHPTSISPYGIEDAAGNAFEWTRQERAGYVQRGGSYWHDRKTANLTNRNESTRDLRDVTLGMRVCATLPDR